MIADQLKHRGQDHLPSGRELVEFVLAAHGGEYSRVFCAEWWTDCKMSGVRSIFYAEDFRSGLP